MYLVIDFPFGFEGRIWDLIVSVPDHCLSFYLTYGYLPYLCVCRLILQNVSTLWFRTILLNAPERSVQGAANLMIHQKVKLKV